MSTKYFDYNLSELTDLQKRIIEFIGIWVHKEKTTVPLKEIIAEMIRQGTKDATTIKAVNSLVKKGYIRRDSMRSNKTRFVQIRWV